MKLRWSKEFAAAKDETIKSKNTQIESLEREIKGVKDTKDEIIKVKEDHIGVLEREIQTYRNFSSDKLKEIYSNTISQLEEQLEKYHSKTRQLESYIQQDNRNEAIKLLEDEKCNLKRHIENLEHDLTTLQDAILSPGLPDDSSHGGSDHSVVANFLSAVLTTRSEGDKC